MILLLLIILLIKIFNINLTAQNIQFNLRYSFSFSIGFYDSVYQMVGEP